MSGGRINMTEPPEPLHQIIVDVIMDHIDNLRRAGIEQVDFRMTHEFYSSFILWALDQPMFFSWKGQFMGARICVDDWTYEWRVLPRVDYD